MLSIHSLQAVPSAAAKSYMSSIASIELFTAISLAVVGLSHCLQPGMWVGFFKFLHSKGQVGNISNALLALGVGSLILSFHFIWYWPEVLVTAYGLMQVIKGAVYLIIPSVGLSSIGRATDAGKFRWVGAVMFALSLLLVYSIIA